MRALFIAGLLLIAGCSSPAPKPPPENILEAREMHRQALDAYGAGRYAAAWAMFVEAEKMFR